MSEPIRLTSSVDDARRIQKSAFFPTLLGVVFSFGVLACFFWGGPLRWFIAIAAGCLLLGRLVQQGSVLGALLLALAVTACAGIGVVGAVHDGWRGFLIILVAVVPAVYCWRAVPATVRLRTRFQTSRPLSARHRTLRIPRDRRMLQAIVPAAICAVYLGLGTIAICIGGIFGGGSGAGYALRPFSKRANRQYRKVLQVLSYRAQELRAHDKRPPVLLLRSFDDEDLALQRRLDMFIRVFDVSRTLEELVVHRIWSVGPVIAVGRPGAQLSPLGAAREYINGPDWQSRVAALLNECSLTVSVLGETEGLLWEYRGLAARAVPLLLVVPHGDAPVLLHRWNSFCSAYPAAASIPFPNDNGGDFPLLVWFQPGHDSLVLTCKYQEELSYELAFDDVLFRHGLSSLSAQHPNG
jgi:hypothetical protein